jgi:hypothetical protein
MGPRHRRIKHAFLCAVAAAFVFAAAAPTASAEDAQANGGLSKFAIGIYGVGNQYTNAQPTLRWSFNPAWALDVTPLVSFNHFDSAGQEGDNHSDGLDLALVKRLSTRAGLQFGIAALAGYSYSSTFIDQNAPAEADQTGKSYSLRFGVGPDLEYRLPSLPNLTIGAHAFLRYTFRQVWGKASVLVPSPPGDTNSLVGTRGTATTHTIGFAGEAFTIRYYF